MNANIKGAIINVVELLIVLICGAVLIITTLDGKPSETIIGIFGGYLGVAFKNSANNNPGAHDVSTDARPAIVITPEPEPPAPAPEPAKKSIFPSTDTTKKKGT